MRLSKAFRSNDHELSCLIYEESLKRGFDADRGQVVEGYFVEVLDCTLTQFAAILIAADQQSRVAARKHRNLCPDDRGEQS